MGQVLRINFENRDHAFRIVSPETITRDTVIMELTVDGVPLKIVKEAGRWVAETSVEGVQAGLITAIAKNITLRFRI